MITFLLMQCACSAAVLAFACLGVRPIIVAPFVPFVVAGAWVLI